jgi:hypothetical protein
MKNDVAGLNFLDSSRQLIVEEKKDEDLILGSFS